MIIYNNTYKPLHQKRISISFFWYKQSNLLSTVALEVLALPATSAPVERIFSASGQIMNQLSIQLQPNMLEICYFACNSD